MADKNIMLVVAYEGTRYCGWQRQPDSLGIQGELEYACMQAFNKKNISISELARRIGQTPQYFGKKLKRDTVSLEEMKQIGDVLEVTFEQSFILPDGEQIKTSNE